MNQSPTLRSFVLLVAVLFASSMARAELKWEARRIDSIMAPGEGQVTVEFRFVNAGADPVNILDLRADCDCTSASTAKRHYRPTEAGAITVVFSAGDQAGVLRKRIFVTTAEAPNQPSVLTLRITVPDVAVVEPAVLLWEKNDPAGSRFITVRLGEGMNVRVNTVKTTSAQIRPVLLATARPSEYRIVFEQYPSERPHTADLTIELEVGTRVVTRHATVVCR